MPLQTILKLVPTPKDLRVQLSVRNNSSRYEIFEQMGCSWEMNWQCDRNGITLSPHACGKNPSLTIVLAPGESFSQEPWPILIEKAHAGRVSFRFGLVRARNTFTNAELERMYQSAERHRYLPHADLTKRRYGRGEEVFWSNKETVFIRNEWLVG